LYKILYIIISPINIWVFDLLIQYQPLCLQYNWKSQLKKIKVLTQVVVSKINIDDTTSIMLLFKYSSCYYGL
jgi:hypothetical protein